MAARSSAKYTPRTASGGTDRVLFLAFVLLFPLLVYPQYLIEMVWEHRGIYFSNGELVYYVPRLVAMLLLVLLTWRSWSLRGWFPKLILANAAWISFVAVLHPDPDGLWYTLGGNIDRLDGLVYQLLLVGVGMAAYGLARRSYARSTGWSRGLRSMLALSGLVPALLVLLQGAGVDPVGWLVWGKALPFASATLGHPAFAACVLLISTLLTLHSVDARARRGFWVALLVVESMALGVTGNRTALAALAVGLAFSWLTRRTRLILVLACLSLIVAIAGGLAPRWYGRPTANGEAHMTSGRTLETRLRLWRIAGKALVSSPQTFVTGFGSAGLLYATLEKLPPKALVPFWRLEKGWPPDVVEKFSYASNGPQFRDVIATVVLRAPDGNVQTQQFYPSVDKAHDYFLDRALTYGIVDSVLWAVLFLVPIVRAVGFRDPMAPTAGVCSVAAALLVFGITFFGVVQTEPLQLVVLATLWGALGQSRARVTCRS